MSENRVSTVFVLLLIGFSCADAQRGSACVTPNGENTKCVPISSCAVLRDAILQENDAAIKFAQTSNCGYDTEILVCCGSMAVKINVTETPLLRSQPHSFSGRGSPCLTPNRERATCTPPTSCKVILNAVATSDEVARKFAMNSVCENKNERLVCCGSEAYPYRGSPLLPDRTVCGYQKGEDRIHGGEITQLNEFPWMALLNYKFFNGGNAGFKCGGTLISRRYVLTAAHCTVVSSVQGFALDEVRLGEHTISTVEDCEAEVVNDECADPVVDVKIEKIIIHPQYNKTTGLNDIALLRLEKDVSYSDYVSPICLPHPNAEDPEPGSKLVVVGWGATENSTSSDYKLKVEVPMVARSECAGKIRQRAQVSEEQVCAGGVEGKDSCKGDSGGPLMGKYEKTINAQSQWYQEGIVSWGLSCGITGYPAIYTRVSKYMQWIIENLSA